VTDRVRFDVSRKDPNTWRAEERSGRTLRVRTPVPGSFVRVSDSVVVGRGPAELTPGDGDPILYQPPTVRGRVEFAPLHGAAMPAVRPLAKLAPRVADWLPADGERSEERWLRHEVDARLAHDDSWQNVVAAGLLARLAAPAAAVWTGNRPPEPLARARQWAREMTPDQRDTLGALLLAEVDRLLVVLESLTETLECEDPGWQADLRDLCLARDDVEGARLLLMEGGDAGRGTGLVMVLDTAGGAFVRSLPVQLRVSDERLRHVARFDPTAWWVALASEAEPTDPPAR
jgi:hypothetical protein